MFKEVFNKINLRWHERIIIAVALAVIIVLVWFNRDDDFATPSIARYDRTQSQYCSSGERKGESGAIYGEHTQQGVKFNVRTPENYDPTVGHPLLVVYSPANSNRAKTEKMTGLTAEATAKGFIVAYADHPELTTSTTIELGTIPQLIAEKWCIDERRIYLTGHSDGGTVAMALAFMNGTRNMPTAIAPSAAGVNFEDLKSHSCPAPISVLIMHSKKDHLFRGYGVETSGWWASCNNCSPIPTQLDNGCIAYSNCDNNVKTWYCEGNASHSKWPNRNQLMLEFLASSARKLDNTQTSK